VASGVVEVVALLGSVKGGFCRSSATWAIVNQIMAVEDKPGPATRRHQPPARCGAQIFEILPTRRRQVRIATSLWKVSWPGTRRHQGQAGPLGGAHEWLRESLTRSLTNTEAS
jgi:hypothetical protein